MSQKDQRIVWIAWEKQRRTSTLATELLADLFQFEFESNSLSRYFVLSIRTVKMLLRNRYDFIFVQNPSIVLCFLVVVLNKFVLHKKVVVDSHTPYIKLSGLKKFIFEKITGFIFRNCSYVIVTNHDLKKEYEKNFRVFHLLVLPDKLPFITTNHLKSFIGEITILLVCTYAEDEPYIEAFRAMNGLNHHGMFVTGNSQKIKRHALKIKPDNVVLTGFIPDFEYFSYINSVDIVMILTEQENCLVCGAYEGLSAEKPLILSNKKVLMEYFNEGVVHTTNNYKDIRKSILMLSNRLSYYNEGIKKLKIRKTVEWQIQWNELINVIGLNN